MRIFNAFLVIFGSVVLFLLPLTDAVYTFRTDVRTDTFTTITVVGTTTANETLLKSLYDNDTGTIEIYSDLATDVPLPNTYNATSRLLNITGLTDNATRTLEVSYDIDALIGSEAVDTLADILPWIWLLVVIGFAPAALLAIFLNKT